MNENNFSHKKIIQTKIYLLIFILFLSFSLYNQQNSTVCHDLYSNNTIDTQCVNNTSCCYYDYTLDYEGFKYECVLKVNSTEDICTQYAGLVNLNPLAKFGYCDCFSTIINHSMTLIAILAILF